MGKDDKKPLTAMNLSDAPKPDALTTVAGSTEAGEPSATVGEWLRYAKYDGTYQPALVVGMEKDGTLGLYTYPFGPGGPHFVTAKHGGPDKPGTWYRA